MKIARYKKAQKILNYYKNNFKFHEPYQILIDGTFCYAALQNKINIKDQLAIYLQSELKFLTTQCIILESESLGQKLFATTQIVKQFAVHKCGHEKEPIQGSTCIKTMIKDSHYIIATQDRQLQNVLRKKLGQPILYLHNRTPVLEQPSDVTKRKVDKKCSAMITNELNIDKLNQLKEECGIPTTDMLNNKKKKFKRKQPNPLSCKKKKKKPQIQGITVGGTDQQQQQQQTPKEKRIRKKIPKHIKEHINIM